MKLHNEDDEAFDAMHTEEGLRMRVTWVKRLLAALRPFAKNMETEADREEARRCLAEIREWL